MDDNDKWLICHCLSIEYLIDGISNNIIDYN